MGAKATTGDQAAATARGIHLVAGSGTEDVSPLLFKRLSDESLGSRLSSGEAAAFDELYRRYVHRLAAYGSHLLGDAAAGEDVAQATLLKAYGVLRDGRLPSKMRPWLFRIAHNAAIDLVVRRREWPSGDLPERAGDETEPMAGALVSALAALPDRQRRVYVLREVHGMRIDETAAELGITTLQVEQSLFAARNRLAELLVFGDRLNCVTVRRLAAGPLEGDERRALKTHLHSCTQCRRAVGARARALGWLPTSSLDWLRGLLVGGAGPAAAKVGAVVASATIAAGVPVVVVTKDHHHAARKTAKAAAPAPVRQAVARPSIVWFRPTAVTLHRIPSRRITATEPERRDASGAPHDGGDSTVEATSAPSGEVQRSGDGNGGGGGDRAAAVEAPTTTATQSGDGTDGGGDSSSITTPTVDPPPASPPPTATTSTVETSPPPPTTTTTSADESSDGGN